MRKDQSKSGNTGKLLPLVLVLSVILCAAGFWFTRSPVELRGDDYDTTLALYRVCNQQSVDGLDQIEARLAAADSQSGEASEASRAIRAIIDDARQDRWRQASENCRRLLEDQVQR